MHPPSSSSSSSSFFKPPSPAARMSCAACKNAQAERPKATGWPSMVDTVIVGNGPSALILSYILHGNVPVYNGGGRESFPHPDALLHGKLRDTTDLLALDVDDVTAHFAASARFPYSTQALPVNVLLDALLRPNGEMEAEMEIETGEEGAGAQRSRSCVAWRYDAAKAVPHVVFGSAPCAGGQWEENPIQEGRSIGTLSYANMLSLPGYSFTEHYWKTRGKVMTAYLRPPRKLVASYFAAYPFQVGIDDAIHCGQKLSGISRVKDGFYIASHGIRCKRLVLASGVFSELIPPPPSLSPLLSLPRVPGQPTREPLLVVGSGFTAADVIISSPAAQKVIHIFKWAPSTSPSPLRACHSQAYPEYAGVYRGMKLAAIAHRESGGARHPMARRPSSAFDNSRDWTSKYEGFPNTAIVDVELQGSDTAVVTLQKDNDPPIQRRVGGLAYVIGRRGSLDYLDDGLRLELTGTPEQGLRISGQSLRQQALDDLEVAPSVFIIGSLTGDSLIRFSYGSCTYAAGKIIQARTAAAAAAAAVAAASHIDVHGGLRSEASSKASSPYIRAMNGFDGHDIKLPDAITIALDRRKEAVAEQQWR